MQTLTIISACEKIPSIGGSPGADLVFLMLYQVTIRIIALKLIHSFIEDIKIVFKNLQYAPVNRIAWKAAI